MSGGVCLRLVTSSESHIHRYKRDAQCWRCAIVALLIICACKSDDAPSPSTTNSASAAPPASAAPLASATPPEQKLDASVTSDANDRFVLPSAKVATGMDASTIVMNSILDELSTHAKLLKPGWRVVSNPPETPIDCSPEGTGCRWLVYVGNTEDLGLTLLWQYFIVDATTGRITVRYRGEEIDLAQWKALYRKKPY